PPGAAAKKAGELMAESSPSLVQLLDALRGGSAEAQGEILQRYQPWLRLLARLQLNQRFQGKFDASDVVQLTMLEAFRAFGQFRGSTEAELTAWLRQILAHVLAHEMRRYHGTAQRDVSREVSLEQALLESSQRLGDMLAAPGSSPSQKAER